ncbi:MAG: adenine-specific methyltransferase EcoRI family protein [Clostridia bacterium]|nr:adenine-specific methyltransferase EcoRI family protein [Clostridia bacterium]
MAGNKNLHKAAVAKQDEFYTQLSDIEKELRYYRKHFKGKTVFCNCDDPFESNFFKYFVLNFNRLGLKKIICTCYAGSPVANTQLSFFDIENSSIENKNKPYKAIVTTVYDKTGDGGIDMVDVAELFKSGENELTELRGDGDFRSGECIELLEQSDIVVTNPPFSLFREYIAQLVEFNKQFIVLGNINAVTYKEIFPYIKDNKIFWGITTNGSNRYFRVPDYYELTEKTGKIENGIKYAFVKGIMWYTNLDFKRLHEEIILIKKYNETDYPKYINFDAIEVSKVTDIPRDYSGVMGVPITFLNKYNPDQFEILGCADYTGLYGSDWLGVKRIGEEWMKKYRTQGGRGHYTANMTSVVYYDNNCKACPTFKRIFIRNKHPEESKK